MSGWQRIVGMAMIGFGLLLAGCAGGSGEWRPLMAMDGQHFDVLDPVENGRGLILTGQFGLAIDTLTQAVGDDPRNARALTLLAVAYGQLKRFDLADRYHAEALQIDPNSVAALNNWGYSYLVRGDRTRAAGLLERAVATSDGRPVVAANLALAQGDRSPRLPVSRTAVTASATPNLRLSRHVTLVRPAGRLLRVAPGVQMLLTIAEEPKPQPAQIPTDTREQAPPQAAASADPMAGMTDTRFALFRALFALAEGEESADAGSMAIIDQVADASLPARPSPFGYFPDVDDFAKQ